MKLKLIIAALALILASELAQAQTTKKLMVQSERNTSFVWDFQSFWSAFTQFIGFETVQKTKKADLRFYELERSRRIQLVTLPESDGSSKEPI